MYTCPIEVSDVRYNAAAQQFEALVTLHDNATVRKYPCAIAAPLTMGFADIARALSKQAIRRHQLHGGLFSHVEMPRPKQLVGRKLFDPAKWLEPLMVGNRRAA